MAQRNGDDTVHRTDFEAYSRYKQEPDNYQQPMAEGSTYQSPIPYPSPQLQNSYAYTPLQDPSLQLPPIKSVEGYNPTQSQYQPALQSGMDRDSQQTAYYPAAGQTHQYPPPPSVDAMSSGQAQAMRHPLQPALNPEDRMMSDKHRKEIKRRTKTGCLTCRKRRIKCDETHPVCRNCQKSKRECAGYDPLFRQQSSPQSLHASVGPDSSSRTTPVASTPEAVNYTSVPHGYAPATNQRYGHRSATSYSPPSSAGHNYEYQTAIDPALAGGDSVNMPSAGTSVLTDGVRLKSETSHENGSPHAPGNEAGQSIIGKRMLKMDDLYMIGGADPPTPNFTEPLSAEKLDQIKYVYTNEYAKGIDHFLETYWYTYDGLDRLMADSQLCELFAGMLELFGTTKSDNYDTLRLIPLTESRVTWLLMCLARTEIPNTSSSSTSEPPPPPPPTQSVDPTILHRLSIFEHLITNRTLPSNPLSDPFNNYNNNNNPPSPTDRCAQFWRELGQYTTYLPSQTAEIDASLARLRLLLDMIENRDVLYSIAIVRRLGPACDGLLRGDHDAAMSASVSEEDRSKLLVAKKFIEDEAAGKGTTQVVQRVCGMAVRSWVWLR